MQDTRPNTLSLYKRASLGQVMGTWYLYAFAESMDNALEITLTYSTTRRELAAWYWRMWKKRLWRFHAAFLVISVAVVVLAAGHWPPSVKEIVRGIAVAVAVVLSLVLFPQIMFKPEVRTLSFDKNGLRTKVGKKSGSVSWQEIESITDAESTIVISRKNLNAFLVPQRAFQSEQERAGALNAIRAWMELRRS